MKTEARIAIVVVSSLIVAIAGAWYWIRLHRQFTSTSAISADSEFLTGAITVTAFVAGGLSFWRAPVAALVVRALVAVWSCLAAYQAISGCFSLWPVAIGTDRSMGGVAYPWLLLAGVALLALYCIATFASALPLVPVRILPRFGFLLQFGLLPFSLLLVDILAMQPEHWFTFSAFGYHLALALGFALLSMRMYALRLQPIA